MLNDYLKEKNWIFSHNNDDLVLKICNDYGLTRLVSNAVINRDDKNYDSFIQLNNSLFHDPFLLNDMDKAVNRIKTAIKNQQTIFVYGDYDVDGITSTYILTHYLKSIGGLVSYYIPSRSDEGYGLNEKALGNLKLKGADLIITVDVGITAVKQAQYCKKIGLDLIITDHHLPSDNNIPDCVAVVNPKISDNYPFKLLAGVGVALKLICAISNNDKNIFDYYIQFCAIGTIADLVDLKDENRFIAKYGLEKIKQTNNKGLLEIIKISGITPSEINSTSIGFGIGPRLNAAGRLSKADICLKLFFSNDVNTAKDISEFLNKENNLRKEEELKIFNEALKIIEEKKLYKNNVIIVASKGWHEGVIGIAASKITEKYYKPSIVMSIDDNNMAKASGRSINGFNLFDALNNCGDTLEKFGGHALAAGLSIKYDNICKFDKIINDYARTVMTDSILTPSIKIDDVIKLDDITLNTIDELKILEPYGMGNPSPVFCIKNVCITQIRNLSDKPHSFLTVYDKNSYLTCPAFSMKDKVSCFYVGDMVDICGSLNKNTFNSQTKPQFLLKDIRPSRNIFYTKNDLRSFYLFLKSTQIEKINLEDVANNFFKYSKLNFGKIKIYHMLNALSQLNMIEFTIFDDDSVMVKKLDDFNKKTNLSLSDDYKKYSN